MIFEIIIVFELVVIAFLLTAIVGNQIKDHSFWEEKQVEPEVKQGPDAIGFEVEGPSEQFMGDWECKKRNIGF